MPVILRSLEVLTTTMLVMSSHRPTPGRSRKGMANEAAARTVRHRRANPAMPCSGEWRGWWLPAAMRSLLQPLSRRQREVATLAGQGATNAEIARALLLSVRTVESHLYAAFAKLGLTAREELSSVLAEHLG